MDSNSSKSDSIENQYKVNRLIGIGAIGKIGKNAEIGKKMKITTEKSAEAQKNPGPASEMNSGNEINDLIGIGAVGEIGDGAHIGEEMDIQEKVAPSMTNPKSPMEILKNALSYPD